MGSAAAPATPRIMGVACVELDADCPNQARVPGLTVVDAVPEPAALAALLKRPTPSGGLQLSRAPDRDGPWLLAAGPLQSPDEPARLQAMTVAEGRLTLDWTYLPYRATGTDRRRFVPSYPVAAIAFPPLPPGPLVVTVRWRPVGNPAAPALVTGPLTVVVP